MRTTYTNAGFFVQTLAVLPLLSHSLIPFLFVNLSPTLHSSIPLFVCMCVGYMLEPDSEKRPDIWQVTEVAFQMRRAQNTVKNVFNSQAPPPCLPTAPRLHNKTTSSNESNPNTTAISPRESTCHHSDTTSSTAVR